MSRIHIITVLISCILVVAGCEEGIDQTYDAQAAMSQLNDWAASLARENSCLSEEAERLQSAAAALKFYGADWANETPTLIMASVGQVPDGQQLLVFGWLESDSDIAALRVLRFMDGAISDEKYPLFGPEPKKRSFARPNGPVNTYLVKVTEATGADDVKDEQAWKTWQANGAKEATRPVIALAPPKSGQKTFLSLIDAKGHESRMLEIKCWTSHEDG